MLVYAMVSAATARTDWRATSVGRNTAVTKVRLGEGLACEVEEGNWKLKVDMSPKTGGMGTAPNPGVYGRARHIHVRAQAPGGPVLTTELFFRNDPSNAGDGLFKPRLAMVVSGTGAERQATFDFVLRA